MVHYEKEHAEKDIIKIAFYGKFIRHYILNMQRDDVNGARKKKGKR